MLFLTAVQAYTVLVADDARPSFYPWGLVLVVLLLAGPGPTRVLRMRFYRRLPDE